MGFFCPHGSNNRHFLHPSGKAGTGTFFHTPDLLPDGAPVFTMTCEPTFKPWLYKHPNSNLIPTGPHCSKPLTSSSLRQNPHPPFQPPPGAVCRLQLQVGGGRRAAAQVLGGGLGWAPGGAEVWGGGLVSGLLSGGG